MNSGITQSEGEDVTLALYDQGAVEDFISQIEDDFLLGLQENGIDDAEIGSIDKTPSDMRRLDVTWCLMTAVVTTFITTNEGFAKWCEGVHDAASDNSGEFDLIQKALGLLFHHKGDLMDKMISRESDSTYIAFHRLLWGHDILARGKGLDDVSFNPIRMMMQQEKSERSGSALLGAVQAMRHLLADTFSKQGLPLPGSSFLDYENSEGKAWNHIIDIVQELSMETTGNKVKAEELYRHLFTIRAQDCAGGGLAFALVNAYVFVNKIEDEIRISQIKFVSYSMSFFAQAIVGSARQNGVPYINYPLAAAMVKELACLFYRSNKRTYQLGKETERLHERAQGQLSRHESLQDLL